MNFLTFALNLMYMKITTILVYICLFLSVKALGSASDGGCRELNENRLKVSVHTSNIMNVDSTRTPHGGHYNKRTLLCVSGECEVKESKDKRVVYEPGHPDANRSGYVIYPDIDVNQEYIALVKAAGELKALAHKGVCEAQVMLSPENILVKYHKSKIISDTFRFKGSKLLSWGRTYSSGKRELFDLSTRVDQKKFATNSFAF